MFPFFLWHHIQYNTNYYWQKTEKNTNLYNSHSIDDCDCPKNMKMSTSCQHFLAPATDKLLFTDTTRIKLQLSLLIILQDKWFPSIILPQILPKLVKYFCTSFLTPLHRSNEVFNLVKRRLYQSNQRVIELNKVQRWWSDNQISHSCEAATLDLNQAPHIIQVVGYVVNYWK